jgi:hypothetical protein
MVTKKGRFGTDPYINFFRKRTPSPTDAFSGMVTKKGRFGTDPYINFFKKGTPKPKTLALRERVRVREKSDRISTRALYKNLSLWRWKLCEKCEKHVDKPVDKPHITAFFIHRSSTQQKNMVEKWNLLTILNLKFWRFSETKTENDSAMKC